MFKLKIPDDDEFLSFFSISSKYFFIIGMNVAVFLLDTLIN